MKIIDIKKNLFELTEENPELIEILVELGFLGVADPSLRTTHGRMMTIPMGCERHGMNLEDVVAKLKEKGYELK